MEYHHEFQVTLLVLRAAAHDADDLQLDQLVTDIGIPLIWDEDADLAQIVRDIRQIMGEQWQPNPTFAEAIREDMHHDNDDDEEDCYGDQDQVRRTADRSVTSGTA